MKIRLAKKIMKQKNYLCLPYDKISDYWYARVRSFEDKARFCVIGKADHRITKMISLTSKISTIVDTRKKKRKYENTK